MPRAVTISFGSSGWSSTFTRRRRGGRHGGRRRRGLGQPQDFCGPMAKQQRMAVLTAACVVGAAEWLFAGTQYALIAAAVVIGMLVFTVRFGWLRNWFPGENAPKSSPEPQWRLPDCEGVCGPIEERPAD